MCHVLNLVYIALLILVSPWLAYQSLRTGKYRQGAAAKFLGRVACVRQDRPIVWLHAVSVGEVNLLQTVLADLEKRLAGHAFVITTTTRTGYALARARFPGHQVSYAPLDFSWAVSAALRRIQPEMLVLVELELWPNLIRIAARQGVKIAIVNGRLSPSSFQGYQRLARLPLLGRVMTRTMHCIDQVAAQDEAFAERFRALGARNVVVTGSVKFDGALTERTNPQTDRLKQRAGYDASHAVFLAGSTQEPEEALALETFVSLREAYPRLRLILVPRHPERFDEVAGICRSAPVQFVRWTQWQTDHSPAPEVLLVDTVGELSAWWGAAQIAFVGGSMGSRGGQNMIEPAAFGAAVCFGSNTRNFRDVTTRLLDGNASVVVHDGEAMTGFVRRCLGDSEYAARLGANAQRIVRSQRGATEKTGELLEQLCVGGNPNREPDGEIRA